jgi:hypothetical protein
LAAFAMFTIAAIGGCSGGSERMQTTVTQTANPPPKTYASAEEPIDTTVPPTTVTTTTTTTTDRPDSVLGATAHAIGTVVMLPFRVVGDTLSLIF